MCVRNRIFVCDLIVENYWQHVFSIMHSGHTGGERVHRERGYWDRPRKSVFRRGEKNENACLFTSRDSVTRFVSPGFVMNQFPPSRRVPIRTVSNFFLNSLRYSQAKVQHRYQQHRRNFATSFVLVLLIPVDTDTGWPTWRQKCI